MSEDTQHVAEMMRSGAYYESSREWYKALYIGPIAERTFFMLIAILASTIALVAFIAVMRLMPINAHPGMIIRSEKMNEVVPRLTRIKPVGEAAEPAMEQALLGLYIEKREGYEVSHYESNYAFVLAHSDQLTAGSYAQMYTSTNPKSPAAILGYNGQRLVAVDNIAIDAKAEPRLATISFHTYLINVAGNRATTRWTAQLQYYYTPLTIVQGKDTAGNETITTQDPQFQVVSYAITQAP